MLTDIILKLIGPFFCPSNLLSKLCILHVDLHADVTWRANYQWHVAWHDTATHAMNS